jgi:hypothetical protein
MYWVKDHGKNGVHVAGTDGDTPRSANSARTAGIPKDAATD